MSDASAAGVITIGGRQVARMGFGTMRLPGPGVWGPPLDPVQAVQVVQRAVELGVRVIDTAWYYGPDTANEVVAEALRPYPEDLVLVTKLGGSRRDDQSWTSAYSPEALRAGCERDLRVLGVESIPVTHLRWSGRAESVTFEEALGTMLDLQRGGKIQHIGLSNVTLDQLKTALEQTPVASVSNAYSIADRRDEPVLRECERRGIPYLPFFPLGVGTAGAQPTIERVARSVGATASQVALAWLLARSPVMLPIPGTSRLLHLEENIAAALLTLSPADLALIDGPSRA